MLMKKVRSSVKNDDVEYVWGYCTAIDLSYCPIELLTNEEHIRNYVDILCKSILGVKRYGDTLIVNFGEDERIAGFSMAQLIETSLISGHFANSLNGAFIDVFSCADYDVESVVDFTEVFFEAKHIGYHQYFREVMIPRNHKLLLGE